MPCPPQPATGTAATTHRRAPTTRIPHRPSAGGGDDTTAWGSPPLPRGPDKGRQTNSCGTGRQPRRPQASQPYPRGEPLKSGGRRLHAPGDHGPARQPHPPTRRPAPGPPDGHRVGDGRHLAPRPCPLLPLAVGAAPLAAHKSKVGDMDDPAGRPAAAGGQSPA